MKKLFTLVLAVCLCFSCSVFANADQDPLLLATEGYELSKTGYNSTMIFGLLNYTIDLPSNQISKQELKNGFVETVFQPYGPYELNGEIYKTGEDEEPLITVSTLEKRIRLNPKPDGSYLTVDEAEKIFFPDGVLPEGHVAETLTINGIKVRCIHPKLKEGFEDAKFLLSRMIIIPEDSSSHDVYILFIHTEGKFTTQAIAVTKHIAQSLRRYGTSVDPAN